MVNFCKQIRYPINVLRLTQFHVAKIFYLAGGGDDTLPQQIYRQFRYQQPKNQFRPYIQQVTKFSRFSLVTNRIIIKLRLTGKSRLISKFK